jgi:hypothetical protein
MVWIPACPTLPPATVVLGHPQTGPDSTEGRVRAEGSKVTSPQAYLVLGSVLGRADFAAIPGQCIFSVHLHHLGTVILIVIYGVFLVGNRVDDHGIADLCHRFLILLANQLVEVAAAFRLKLVAAHEMVDTFEHVLGGFPCRARAVLALRDDRSGH